MAFDIENATRLIVSKLEKKPFREIESKLYTFIRDFLQYDTHFMRLTGIEDGQEYDEDEAFEYIYDAYLSDHPDDDDESMLVATLLNRYMELKDEYYSDIWS